MRQSLSDKKVKKLKELTGLKIKSVLVRGGTDHRRDLLLTNGKVIHLYKDGKTELSVFRWKQKENIFKIIYNFFNKYIHNAKD